MSAADHRPSRAEKCLAYLATCEDLCGASDCLRDLIDDTQSLLWLEVAGWHELESDVADLESRCHAHADRCRAA